MKKLYTLNSDMGENAGYDEQIMPYIDWANIACGYHAGDVNIMHQTVALAIKYHVQVGAHPSYLDRENFGRTVIHMDVTDVYDLITQQLIILNEITGGFEIKMHHVKPHGALYNMSAKDASIARSIALAVKDFDPELILVGLSGSHSITEAKAIGLRTANEVFADRTYQDDGTLTARTHPSALIEDEEAAVKQVIQMITKGTVNTISGTELPIRADTICIHGDGKQAASFSKAIFAAVKQ